MSSPSLLTTSLPLGSLIFSLHNFLADPSTLVAASWTGYENGKPRGPLPHVHGPLTMVVLCLGVALGVSAGGSRRGDAGYRVRKVLESSAWWALGCAGAYGVYIKRNWEGYGAGLVLAFVLASIAPLVWENVADAARGGGESDASDEEDERRAAAVGKVYASAMLVYVLLNLASVFTVAYAFVPGGWVFRERTDA